MDSYEVIIIGLGPAGCTAGIYATRFGLKTLVIGKEPGGQANEAYEVDNYPGMLRVKGMDIMNKFREQTKELGAEIIYTDVVDINKKGDGFIVKTESDEYGTKSVIIATGAKKRRLDIPGENELRGRGISYCGTCDAPFYKGKTVVVVGGGSSAVMTALMLTEHAKKIYIAYRKCKKDMRAMPAWVTSAEANPKIEMVFNAVPKRIEGSNLVEAMVFDKEGKTLRLKVEGVFVEIGSIPQTELAQKLGAVLEKSGKIKVGHDMTTSVRGVFAAGDVTGGSADFEQIIIAASEGANAARSAYKYVRKRD
ncbi:MAG: FAD-dependent oxidoreductase [Candidatus Aenigmatarchaeota archaeon]